VNKIERRQLGEQHKERINHLVGNRAVTYNQAWVPVLNGNVTINTVSLPTDLSRWP